MKRDNELKKGKGVWNGRSRLDETREKGTRNGEQGSSTSRVEKAVMWRILFYHGIFTQC